jgi:hypothetical protein
VADDVGGIEEYMVSVDIGLVQEFNLRAPSAVIAMRQVPQKDVRLRAWNVQYDDRISGLRTHIPVCFRTVPRPLIERYKARHRQIRVQTDSGWKRSPLIPIAEPISLWADKVVAVAYRPNLRWRDVYDLVDTIKITEVSRRPPCPEEEAEQIRISASMFDHDQRGVLTALRTLGVHGRLEDSEAYDREMSRCELKNIFGIEGVRGYTDYLLADARREVGRVITVLEETLAWQGLA